MATKPKATPEDASRELDGLLSDFARYLRDLEPSLADNADPAMRAIARKGLRAYVVELERMTKKEPDGPPPAAPPEENGA